MKNIILLLPLLWLLACNASREPEKLSSGQTVIEPEEILKGEYQLVRDNLYTDKAGNLYFRTIDMTSQNANGEVPANYTNRFYCDAVVNGKSNCEQELKDLIDPATFRKTGKMEGLMQYYCDKNHRYFHRLKAYGGEFVRSQRQ